MSIPMVFRSRHTRLGAAAALIGAGLVCGSGRAQDEKSPPPVPPVKGAVVLFNGSDTSQWVRRGTDQPISWKVSDGAMTAGGGDIATRENYNNFQLHLEWMEPDMPNARGQAKGNSGIGLEGRYEIQILDSYGWAVPGKGDCGAVYGQAAPLVNACKPALHWQTFDIVYRGPRFQDGTMTEKPRVTVVQNGIVIQDNTEIASPTGIEHGDRDFSKPGPIVVQDHGHPVKFRDIWIVPLPAKGSDQYAPK
jgi:hypothetical protein